MIIELFSSENSDLNSLNKDRLFKILGDSYDDETCESILLAVDKEVLEKEINLLEEKLKINGVNPENIKDAFVEHLWYMYMIQPELL